MMTRCNRWSLLWPCTSPSRTRNTFGTQCSLLWTQVTKKQSWRASTRPRQRRNDGGKLLHIKDRSSSLGYTPRSRLPRQQQCLEITTTNEFFHILSPSPHIPRPLREGASATPIFPCRQTRTRNRNQQSGACPATAFSLRSRIPSRPGEHTKDVTSKQGRVLLRKHRIFRNLVIFPFPHSRCPARHR